jgi:proteasome accessory factor B
MEKIPAYAERWTGEDDTARATARRTFERDKDELRGLGIPIQTVRYSINFGTEQVEGYRIDRRDFYLPYLRLISRAASGPAARPAVPGGATGGARVAELGLSEAEATLSLEALRRVAKVPSFPLAREARSAFRKLAFDLDPAAFAAGTPVLFVDRPGSDELRERLRLLSDALLAHKRVRFRYRGMYREEATDRDVAAYGLLFQYGHWYLAGHDALRDDIRVFRVGRMEHVVMNRKSPGTPDYDIPADFRVDEHMRREPWRMGEREEAPLRAEVLFQFPISLWAERNGHGELVAQRADGAQLRRFDVYQVQPFLRWLLGLEGDAEPLSPRSLRAELRALAGEIARTHLRTESDNGKGDEVDDG